MNATQTIHDQNLLFGILAVQLDFVSQQQLMEAMQSWLLQKSKSVAQILIERGVLSAERRQLLANLVREHLRQHDNDPQKSILAISPPQPLCDELNSLRDPMVSRVISRVADASMAPPPQQYFQTMPHAGPQESSSNRRYVFVRPLDEGGLGKVSVAMDTEVSREVALKEIKPMYADNTDSRARFLKEAEITGRLEHPGIVPVYGLGTYDDGRPYYAMRMISGCSLKEAIQEFHEKDQQPRDPGERRLALCELLQRFISVCHAMEYAHSRGIVHRDLKPANVMLGKFRETLVVDWGLAKPVGEGEQTQKSYETVIVPELGNESVPTRMGEVVGTTAFMSPEQAGGKLRELGPPSDIYSLGATLYNLITGTVSQSGGDLAQQLRQILQGKFPKPREANRRVDRVLESICLKAMALHPRDRYPSAKALAEDVEKYLADEPTSAHHETWGERLSRWERRYRTLVRTIAAALAVVATLAVVFAGVFQKQRNYAQSQEQIAIREQEKAQRAEVRAEGNLAILVDILGKPDPEADGRTVTIYDAMRDKAQQIPELAAGDPLTEAWLSKTIGVTFFNLGLMEEAIPLMERAREGFTAVFGAEESDTLAVVAALGAAYSRAGRHDKAIPILEDNLKRSRAKFGEDHESTIHAASNLASGYQAAQQWDKALALLKDCLQRGRTLFGEEAPQTLSIMNNLASGYQAANNMQEALPLFEETWRLTKKVLGPDHPNTLQVHRNLAVAYQAVEQYDKALQSATETWELRRKRFGPEEIQTIRARLVMQAIHWEQGEFAKAEALAREAIDKLDRSSASFRLDLARAQLALAEALVSQEKLDEAEPFARESADDLRDRLPNSFERWRCESVWGASLADREPSSTAEKLLRDSFAYGHREWRVLQPFQRRYVRLMGQRLVSLYEASDQPEAANRVKSQLEELADPA